MTIETIADMIWGLEQDIDVRIFDPRESSKNHKSHTTETVGNAITPLLEIASSTPASNAPPRQSLGTERPARNQEISDYRSQLVGVH
jgi:hypothetical protein